MLPFWRYSRTTFAPDCFFHTVVFFLVRDFCALGYRKGAAKKVLFFPQERLKIWPQLPKASQGVHNSAPKPQKAPEWSPRTPQWHPGDSKMEVKRTQQTVSLRKNTWMSTAKSPVDKGTVAARRAANWNGSNKIALAAAWWHAFSICHSQHTSKRRTHVCTCILRERERERESEDSCLAWPYERKNSKWKKQPHTLQHNIGKNLVMYPPAPWAH